MNDASAFIMVVFPEPAPPVIIMFIGSMLRPSTITQRKAANSLVIVFFAMRSTIDNGMVVNFLIVSVGPIGVTLMKVAFALSPLNSRASSNGSLGPMFFPIVEAILFIRVSRVFSFFMTMLVLHIPYLLWKTNIGLL